MYFLKNKIGLCLSGGAALGLAHIGVIRALEELAIKPQMISGSSMGAIIGALYANGYNSQQLEEIMRESEIDKIFKLVKPNFNWKSGLSTHQKIEDLLYKYIPHNSFDDLKIPIRICVTDIMKPDWEIKSEGNLIKSLLASMSLPMFFEPTVVDGKIYMDGGIMNNLPVEPLIEECHKIIGVDVQDCNKIEEIGSLKDMALRQYNAMMKEIQKPRVAQCDIYVNFPALETYELYDFSKFSEIKEIGYHRTMELLKETSK